MTNQLIYRYGSTVFRIYLSTSWEARRTHFNQIHNIFFNFNVLYKIYGNMPE